jgi:hypothetical protein
MGILASMIDMIKIKTIHSLKSKMGDLLNKFVSEGFNFLQLMEMHFSDVSGYLQKDSFFVLLTIYRFNVQFFEVPCPHIKRRGLALIAKLAKKNGGMAETLKDEFDLKCDVAVIDEKQLTQLIMNLDFKKLPICGKKSK